MITKPVTIIGSGENESPANSIMPAFYPITGTIIKCQCCDNGHYSLKRIVAEMGRKGITTRSGKTKCSKCNNTLIYSIEAFT